MKLLTFIQNGNYRLGVKEGQGVVDVLAALSFVPAVKKVPTTAHEVIEKGDEAVSALREYIDHVLTLNHDNPTYILDESKLIHGPCVTNPNKIICVGLIIVSMPKKQTRKSLSLPFCSTNLIIR